MSGFDAKEVKVEKSEVTFKFGDGKAIESQKKVIFPAYIGKKKITISTHVIGNELPLLLSKDAMKKAMTTIDFGNDRVKMLDQTLNLQFTTSGHYIVPIAKTVDNFTKEEIIVLVDNIEHLMNDKDKVALKLHLHSDMQEVIKS